MAMTIGEVFPETGYIILSDMSVMPWAAVGYNLLLTFALVQAWLICSVLISGLINRFKENDFVLLRLLGACTNIVNNKRKLLGSMQIALAICMAWAKRKSPGFWATISRQRTRPMCTAVSSSSTKIHRGTTP